MTPASSTISADEVLCQRLQHTENAYSHPDGWLIPDEKSLTTTTTTLNPAVIEGVDNEADESDEDQDDVDEDEADENQMGAVGDRSSDKESSRRKKNSANSATMISGKRAGKDNSDSLVAILRASCSGELALSQIQMTMCSLDVVAPCFR